MLDITFQSATSLAQNIRQKKISVVELIETHIARIETVNPHLNAVVQTAFDRARQEAKTADLALAQNKPVGPLHGVPITLKDSLDTIGIVTTWGTTGRRDKVPMRDATAVSRLRQAGAIILGKTNTPELTLGGEMDNPVYGRSYNPYDTTKSPGGSSGGAAAILAAGGSALDLGSDTGGSIREPAHMCGIAGLKPTFGRIPITGHPTVYGLSSIDGFTQIGPMARFVEDLILTLPLLIGPDGHDPTTVPMPLGQPSDVDISQLRIAFYIDGGLSPVETAIANAILAASQAIAQTGARVTEATPVPLARAAELHRWVMYADRGLWMERILQEAGSASPGPHIGRLLHQAKTAVLPPLAAILQELAQFRRNMLTFINNYDAIICPVEPYVALPHGAMVDNIAPNDWGHMSAYNITGWPAGSVRVSATDNGLPVGIQVVAKPWREDIVLAIMKELESIFGGYQPPNF
ncbi:MAG: amidase [Chloroflexota bacterium]